MQLRVESSQLLRIGMVLKAQFYANRGTGPFEGDNRCVTTRDHLRLPVLFCLIAVCDQDLMANYSLCVYQASDARTEMPVIVPELNHRLGRQPGTAKDILAIPARMARRQTKKHTF